MFDFTKFTTNSQEMEMVLKAIQDKLTEYKNNYRMVLPLSIGFAENTEGSSSSRSYWANPYNSTIGAYPANLQSIKKRTKIRYRMLDLNEDNDQLATEVLTQQASDDNNTDNTRAKKANFYNLESFVYEDLINEEEKDMRDLLYAYHIISFFKLVEDYPDTFFWLGESKETNGGDAEKWFETMSYIIKKALSTLDLLDEGDTLNIEEAHIDEASSGWMMPTGTQLTIGSKLDDDTGILINLKIILTSDEDDENPVAHFKDVALRPSATVDTKTGYIYIRDLSDIKYLLGELSKRTVRVDDVDNNSTLSWIYKLLTAVVESQN